jgi:hypothetical protein
MGSIARGGIKQLVRARDVERDRRCLANSTPGVTPSMAGTFGVLMLEFGCRLPMESDQMARKAGKRNAAATKAARTPRRRAAGLKAAARKRGKGAARKAATTRRRRAAGHKVSAKKRKAAARRPIEARSRGLFAQTPDEVAEPIEIETFSAEILTTTITDEDV